VPEFDDFAADAIAAAKQPVVDFTIEKNFAFEVFGLSVIDTVYTESVIEQ